MTETKKGRVISSTEKMPKDFWNYRVNPIVGYYIRPIKTRDLGKRDINTDE